MARYTIKDLKLEVWNTNNTITDTGYKIVVKRQYGAYYLYQANKEEETSKVIRLLFAGSARECAIYLFGIKEAKWYF